MAKLELKDKVVDQNNFFQLTIDLQLKHPDTSLHTGNTKTYSDKIEVHDPFIEYDESAVSEVEVEEIAEKHGFEKR